MSVNPNYDNVQTESGCSICGFMDPDFKDTDDLYSSYCPREFGGIAKGGVVSDIDKVYSIWSQHVPERYSNHDSFSWYQAVGPDWLREQLKSLFPEATDPVPLSIVNDRAAPVPGSSGDSLRLLYRLNQCQKKPNYSGQHNPISQQKPLVFAPLMSSQQQAASVTAGNNSCIAQQYSYYALNQNISNRTSVQPCTNTQLPETLYSNVENSSNNETTPTVSSSKEMSYEKFSTKEMCMISEMTPLTTHGHISSGSETSDTTNKQNEWKQTEYLYIKGQEEKQSFQDSHAPVTSGNNGSAHGARPKAYSKATVTASRTSVSEDLTNWALPSEGSEGRRQWCSFCAKNGETRTVVMSHTLYNSETNTLHCPILRAHHCEVCNATGDFAHTRTYCPRIRMLQGDMESTITALKSTRRQASGKVRNNKAIMKLPK